MKYIRTEDNIWQYDRNKNIVRPSEDGKSVVYWLHFDEEDIIKQADTIEELCDVFDWKWNETEFPYSIARQHDRYDGYGDLKRAMRGEENYGKYLNQDYEIYGAIWTDKGLIYAAKMNSKGELELI